MAHFLLIKDANGNILKTVPVPPGYQVVEMSDKKIQEMNKLLPADKRISLDDSASATDKAGPG